LARFSFALQLFLARYSFGALLFRLASHLGRFSFGTLLFRHALLLAAYSFCLLVFWLASLLDPLSFGLLFGLASRITRCFFRTLLVMGVFVFVLPRLSSGTVVFLLLPRPQTLTRTQILT
jgi:hypothetical protein